MKAVCSVILAGVVAAASPLARATPDSAADQSAAVPGVTLFRDIARRQNPVAVSVVTRRHRTQVDEDEGELLRLFEMDTPEGDSQVRLEAASGIIISTSGEILTNHHVVEGSDRIDVTLFGKDRQRYRAIRVASDPSTDTALIRLEHPPSGLQVATFGDSGALEPGDWVLAIGNPFQFGHTVTAGVVSFSARPFQVGDGRWQDLIQTDTSINRGNSGGPLFNMRGEVVGVNVAMVDGGYGSSAGIGFAVPINTVKTLLPQLRSGRVVRGQLGVGLHGGPILDDEAAALRLPVAKGAVVRSVERGSAADRAGMRAGDVITMIDGGPVEDTRDLLARTAATTPGTRVTVQTYRNGEPHTLIATIEAQPGVPGDTVPQNDAERDDGLTLGEIRHGVTAEAAAGGVLIVDVTRDSPADEAELKAGDVIRMINGRSVRTLADARRALGAVDDRAPIYLLVEREESELFLEMRRD